MPLASLLLALILSLACQANAAPASGEFIENAELFQAIRDRDYILIAYLLRNEIPLGPLNGRENGYTPLHQAAFFGDPRSTIMLIESGADPLAVWLSKEGGVHTPLTLALERRYDLIQTGQAASSLMSPECNHLVVADMLIDRLSKNPKHKETYYRFANKWGQDAIELAAATRNMRLFEKLVTLERDRYDMTYNNEVFRNWTLLHYLSDVDHLLKMMAETFFQRQHSKSEITALERFWNITIPKDAFILPDKRSYNRTVFLPAVSEWNLKFIKLVVDLPNAPHLYHLTLLGSKDLIGQTPLHMASDSGDTGLLKYYLDKVVPRDFVAPSLNALDFMSKVMISPTTDFQHTPLHIAAYKGHADAVQVWCDTIASFKTIAEDFSKRAGRSVSIINFYGVADAYQRTPLDVALDFNTRSVLRRCMGIDPPAETPSHSTSTSHTQQQQPQQKSPKLPGVPLIELGKEGLTTKPPLVFKTALSGWREVVSSEWDIQHCNIDRKAGLSVDDFVKNYFSVKKPVVLVGAAKEWPAYQKWKRSSFLQNYGDVEFTYGRIPYGNQYGNVSSTITAKSYINQMDENPEHPMYLFDNKVVSKIPALVEDCLNSEYFTGLVFYPMQFMLGPANSGSNIHYHTNAWCNVIHGRKRWFLFPPSQAFLSAIPISNWLQGEYTLLEERPFECYQNPGDIVFVPESWGHGVVNIHDTIAVSMELMRYYSI